MRSLVELGERVGPVPADIVRALTRIERGAGREELHRWRSPTVLDSLARRARVESIRTSSEIEGVVVEPARAAQLARGATPRTRSEAEFAGYRDALDHLHGAGADEPFGVPLVLRLHRLLYGHTDAPRGQLKQHDNRVVAVLPDGRQIDRFGTVPARETEFAMRELHARLDAALAAGEHHPILLVGAYVLDLLVIHPFDNGNGRVARLATTALLQRSGFGVVRYVAIEGLVDRTSDEYYRSLADSTAGWHDGGHDLWPWLRYLTARIAEGYQEFERAAGEAAPRGGKLAQVVQWVLHLAPPTFSKDDIRDALPDISDATITRALQQLRREGKLRLLGLGPTARWGRI